MDQSNERTAPAFARFMDLLGARGLRAAMADLLLSSEYRYIGLFRFDGERAIAVVYVDREHPEQERADDVPASATYCSLVREGGQALEVEDALQEQRLATHPAREQVRAYCGVPVFTPEGEFLATLCHFDHVPRDPSQLDLALLCEISSAIEQGGHLPPVPSSVPTRVPPLP